MYGAVESLRGGKRSGRIIWQQFSAWEVLYGVAYFAARSRRKIEIAVGRNGAKIRGRCCGTADTATRENPGYPENGHGGTQTSQGRGEARCGLL